MTMTILAAAAPTLSTLNQHALRLNDAIVSGDKTVAIEATLMVRLIAGELRDLLQAADAD